MRPKEKYLKLFRTEAADLVQRVGRVLLELEDDPSRVEALRQDLHTLKGSARLVGLTEIGEIVHTLESFAAEGSDLSEGDADAVDLALEALDQVEGLAGLGKPAPEPDEIEAMLARLRGQPVVADEPLLPSSPPGPPAPAPAPPPRPAPAAAPPPPQQASMAWDPPRESVRVSAEILDQLLTLSGELLLQHRRMAARFDQGKRILSLVDSLRSGRVDVVSGLDEVADALGGLSRGLEGDMVDAGFLFSEVRDRTADLRLEKVSTILEPLERQLRAESRRDGKPVRIHLRGGHLEMDRAILEQIKPVLVHTLTNALAHGIEPPDVRLAQGKPREGVIRVTARADGNRVQMIVEDDGKGLDPGVLRDAAVQKGFLSRDEAEELEDEDALNLIFTPGFSTAKVVTRSAGRGVGMDAVRANVERLRGQIRVESEQGRFTRVTFVLPAAIGVLQALLVEVAGERVAIPLMDVQLATSWTGSALRNREGYLQTGQGDLPVESLQDILGWPQGEGQEAPADRGMVWALVLRHDDSSMAVVVDRVLREEEVVLKHPGRVLSGLPFLAGVTVFADGTPAVVLATGDVLREGQRRWRLAALERGEGPRAPASGRVLLAEDSHTSRALMQDALEDAGFQVVTAEDGREALSLLEKVEFRALVSDYEMPHVDGIELVQALRTGAGPNAGIPVVMVTTRAEEIREMGLAMGANRVMPKGVEDYQEMVEWVRTQATL